MEMTFDPPLVRGTLIRRYKRFLADVRLDTGEEVVAHCPNPGSMRTCAEPGWTAWVSPANNPKRKLKWTLELIESDTAHIMVNTARPNKVVEAAIRAGQIEELDGYETIRPEVKYGENSRIDLLLTHPDRPDCYVEIKNVTLLHSPGTASFPDSVSKRASKHMRELAAMAAEGHRSVVFFLVSRTDVEAMRPADDIDPAYGEALRSAIGSGVEAIAHGLSIDEHALTVSRSVPILL
jgi:sugar fermentation stimulation protein A